MAHFKEQSEPFVLEIETGKCCSPKTLVLHGYAAKITVNKCGKSTKTK